MRTALDTNILSALWSRQPLGPQVLDRITKAHLEGGLVICGPVYVELYAGPSVQIGFVDTFLTDTAIVIDFDLDEDVWRLAAIAFASYVKRRRRSGGGTPKRLPVDFLVGAHASLRADRLMTLDLSPYQLDFPALRLVSI